MKEYISYMKIFVLSPVTFICFFMYVLNERLSLLGKEGMELMGLKEPKHSGFIPYIQVQKQPIAKFLIHLHPREAFLEW